MKPIRRGRPDDTSIVQTKSPDPGERRGKSGSPERPLWWLLGASIVLPLLVLAVGSAISYHQNFLDAEDRLERTLGTVVEHATKVFETFEITAIYVDQLIGDASKARQTLGWTPSVKFDELVKMMVEADLARLSKT